MSSTTTGTRTRLRPHWLLPDRHSWVDIVATLALTMVAISGLGNTFTGSYFLVVAAVGAVLGVVLTQVTRAAGWPLISAVVGVVVLFYVLGGPLTLRSLGDWAVFPGAQTLARLTDEAVFGWKDLLTTLPPVDGGGPLLVLPWVLGLLGGLLTLALAHQPTKHPWLEALLPVLGQVALLTAVILIGVSEPHSVWVQGAVFAGLALLWLALRGRRASATVRGGESGRGRAAAGAALIAVAVAAAVPVSQLVAHGDERLVARTWVEPPFDIGQYPSPLAGFRRYVDPKGSTSDDTNVHDETLFEVDGLAPGTRVRLAAMDRYDGTVWGASDEQLGDKDNTFKRVSSVIHNPVDGREVEATVTLGEGWNGVWLPTAGALQSVEFEIGDPIAKQETFRYNLSTSTAVVPSGLRNGDRYTFTAVLPDDSLDRATVGSDQGSTRVAEAAFLQGPVQKWTEEVTDPMGRVLAAARHLRTQGRYSDGIGRTERGFVAGHNVWRLSDEFVNAPQMVGNDEQYAAVMALVANEVGVPARVVLGAEVPEDGRVTGKDVSAWVELQAADGSWRTLDTEKFMSDEPPAEQTPLTETPMTGTVIPPPNPIPPPSDAGEQTDADLKERKATRRKADDEDEASEFALPGWVRVVLTYVGPPVLLVTALLGAIVGLKLLRRRRRRNAASTSARFVGAWNDLVDHARDLGRPVPAGSTTTRREQSGTLGSDLAPTLARTADRWVFGPRVPDAGAAAEFWASVDAERRTMSRGVGRRRRLLAAIDPRTLRPGRRR